MGTEGKADLDGPEMSDEQTRAQVVDPAKRLVQAVGLQLRGASFRFSACTDQGVAPFRGRVSMGFTFPTDADKDAYIDKIVAAMTADGWRDGAPEGKQPHGRALHQGDVMAIVTPNPDHPDRGYIQILGECRNAADHSGDDEDIRAELTS
ncbi:hypothetical protein MDOR_38810 [Mycolicibacterium doricum]|uniref:Lipoprotein LppJ n=1 Tax=Mycolicibacterium doricum TaxID=126673 RepID=A0A1X1T8P8_9MYCO|nr:hypothetical protein [Mycolicibacterium doricum]MCV7267426.1 hypothetical protein [Mycolicibacterium doricum]ORV40888.1 hypothetical protein AWC01_10505 [Mycolicibacterium doricum]BBZ09712.1 hypothetical protein MDOR_38810 [Mycolicibacterium doricum]